MELRLCARCQRGFPHGKGAIGPEKSRRLGNAEWRWIDLEEGAEALGTLPSGPAPSCLCMFLLMSLVHVLISFILHAWVLLVTRIL